MARRKKTLRGPARAYRRDPQRYEAARWQPSQGGLPIATRFGCRDAIIGIKNPYKPQARGMVAAYREGYRICDKLLAKRPLDAEEARVAKKLDLDMDVRVGTRRGLRGAKRKRK